MRMSVLAAWVHLATFWEPTVGFFAGVGQPVLYSLENLLREEGTQTHNENSLWNGTTNVLKLTQPFFTVVIIIIAFI